ncbi:hypothetical protein ACKC9G_03490 [Pokkaliibacter sp. CJK22405]|uniref:hypothetical protein n=1 Tax=Pokkaliibacter sp. CJK22405 TaxID=3384615 RepID=UPI003984FE3D
MRWEVLRLEEQIAQVEKRLEWAIDRDDSLAQDKLEQQLESLERHLAKLQGDLQPDPDVETTTNDSEEG